VAEIPKIVPTSVMTPIRKSWGAKITTSLLQNEKKLARKKFIFIIFEVLDH